MTCAWIKPPQAISVEFGKPDIPMPIQSQLVGCAGQQLDLLWVTGVWNREPGKGIELVMSRRKIVVSEIVGSLFGEPDGIVLGHQDAHNAVMSVWRRQVLEGLSPWVKDHQRILAHGSKPESPLVIDGWTHHLAIRLR